MTAVALRLAPRGWRSVVLVMTGMLAAAAWPARAEDVPPLRQGLWEFQRSAGANQYAAKECIDPSDDLRRQHVAWEKIGCKVAPALHSGATYTYAAECSVKLPSGAVSFSTTSVLTAESDVAYRIDNRITSRNGTSSESITAQRVADCSN
jgi:hypothetical protein